MKEESEKSTRWKRKKEKNPEISASLASFFQIFLSEGMKTLRALKKEEEVERRIILLSQLKSLTHIILLLHQWVKEVENQPDSQSFREFSPSLLSPGKRKNAQGKPLLPHWLELWDLETSTREGEQAHEVAGISKQEFSPSHLGQQQLMEKILNILHSAKEEGALILSCEELARKLAGNKRLLKKMLKEVGSSDWIEFLRKMRKRGL
ncbi:MAG: hypothetical protein ACK4G3_05160, partial [bacterium]